MAENHSMEELAKRLSVHEREAFTEFGRIFGLKFRSMFVRKYGLTEWEAKNLAISCITDISLKVRDHYRARDDSCFEAWVFTLAKRIVIDWLRKQKKRKHVSKEILERIRCDDDADIEPSRKTVLVVREAIKRLSDTDQTIIRLRHYEGKTTFVEISKTLDIKPGTVRVRYTRALKRLKETLEADSRIHELMGNENKKKENPETDE